MDGIEATRLIMAGPATTRVLVLTTFDEDDYVYGALRAGASGFMVKDMALDDILAAVRVVAAGDALIAPGVTRRLIADFVGRTEAVPERSTRPPRPVEGITEREREVLTLVGRGRVQHRDRAGPLHHGGHRQVARVTAARQTGRPGPGPARDNRL
nr:response regulator transcription factor [Streptomyces xanthophaeus]